MQTFDSAMRTNNLGHRRIKGLRTMALLVICLCIDQSLGNQEPKAVDSPADKQAVRLFERRVNDYVKQRNRIKERLPKLSKDSTPEQIQAFKTNFVEALRAARQGAKRGDLFTPQVASYIDRTLREEFRGKDRIQLREIVFEAETEGVPMRVNYPYPASAEMAEMPPTLLLKLPQLPKELRYRFVGRNLILVDRESSVIVDFITGALP